MPLLKLIVFPAQTGVFDVTDGVGNAFTITSIFALGPSQDCV